MREQGVVVMACRCFQHLIGREMASKRMVAAQKTAEQVEVATSAQQKIV